MKINQMVGLIVLSFLLLSGMEYVYGEESKQEYVIIDLSKCEMEPCPMDKTKKYMEKALVVHPNVIITIPKNYEQLDMTYDGEYNGIPARYLRSSYKDSLKAYLIFKPQKVSNDIPPEILKAYDNLVLMGLDGLWQGAPKRGPHEEPNKKRIPV